MIKILVALYFGMLLYTLSLIITAILIKDKVKTVFLGNPDGKKYFKFKIFNTDIVITSWFFISSYVETISNSSKQKYIMKVIFSVVISLLLLYICTFSIGISKNINYNVIPLTAKQTNERVINNIQSIKTQTILPKYKSGTALSTNKENSFDIFFKITLGLIIFNFLYNTLRLFLSDKILFKLILFLFILLIIRDILSIL